LEKDFEAYVNINDIYLFNVGEAQQAYNTFGCHYIPQLQTHRFMVWAPNARAVSVVGDFNDWDPLATPMQREADVFYAFVNGLKDGDTYKYHITGFDGGKVFKADPFAFHTEVRPKTASKVWNIQGFAWHDADYRKNLEDYDVYRSPVSIYEMHIGSWRQKPDYRFPNIREVADELASYASEMGYTHVELLPVTEYPLDDSWGYQVTGFFAPTSRYGTPQDYMYFVDKMHQHGIGVILDWVPAHFPKDAHGLAKFDGTCLFEHQNPIQANHPQWGTLIFNYGRPEVVSFLVSSALMFFDLYHIDGIRVDAVTSMLYLNYARKKGEYIPNEFGGDIDLNAVEFLKKLNATILCRYPKAITVAEESTAYPKITQPPYDGGLGFTHKWNMGFMHDTLKYMGMDPLYRQFNHDKITFSMFYAFTENFILPYSHDEVVHGKKSMIDKISGDYDQKFASLRLLYGFMFAHPGKKLMFMGCEYGQFIEWDYKKELDWFLLAYPRHKEMQAYVKALNHFYKANEALYDKDDGWDGFIWLNVSERQKSSVCFMRTGREQRLVCAFNFTPVSNQDFRIGLPGPGTLTEVFSSDGVSYGGGGVANAAPVENDDSPYAGLPQSAKITLPPMSALYFEFSPHKNTDEGEKDDQ
jgi:1,4-alpha-glucan branching enzyme